MWCILKTVSNCCTAPLKRNWQLLLAHHDPRIHIRILRLTASVAKVNCFSFLDPRQIPCLLFIKWQLLFIKLGDNWQQIKHLSLQNMSKLLNTHPYLVYCWPPLRSLFKLFVISVFHWDRYNWMKFIPLKYWLQVNIRLFGWTETHFFVLWFTSLLIFKNNSRVRSNFDCVNSFWLSLSALKNHTNMKRTNYN